MSFFEILKYGYWKYRLAIATIQRVVNGSLRRALEPLGVTLFSKPARSYMDDKLAQYLPDRGVFVEAGATDGYTESNTYYLERFKNWGGC